MRSNNRRRTGENDTNDDVSGSCSKPKGSDDDVTQLYNALYMWVKVSYAGVALRHCTSECVCMCVGD